MNFGTILQSISQNVPTQLKRFMKLYIYFATYSGCYFIFDIYYFYKNTKKLFYYIFYIR